MMIFQVKQLLIFLLPSLIFPSTANRRSRQSGKQFRPYIPRKDVSWTALQYSANFSALTDEQRLVANLFQSYHPHSRPVVNVLHSVVVGMQLTIIKIFELDEKNQVLISNVWIVLEWKDEYLKWKPKQYSDLETIRIPSSLVWKPDVVLYNSADDYTKSYPRVLLSSNGRVVYRVPSKLTSLCKIDVTYFPFDEQLCTMKFGSWTYDGFKVDLINSSMSADLSFYVESGEWDLVYTEQVRNVVVYTCCIEPYPDVTISIRIRRKTLYYMLNVCLPCILLSSLALLVFLLPIESGEKCGLTIAVLLGFAVFMLTVIEKLPETSESVPLICIYVSGVQTSLGLSICSTIVVFYFHHKAEKCPKMPRCLERFLSILQPLFGSSTARKQTTDHWVETKLAVVGPNQLLHQLADNIAEMSQPDSAKVNELLKMSEDYRDFIIGITRLAERYCDEVESQVTAEKWRRLALIIDHLLFTVLTLAISLFTIYVLAIVPYYHLRFVK